MLPRSINKHDKCVMSFTRIIRSRELNPFEQSEVLSFLSFLAIFVLSIPKLGDATCTDLIFKASFAWSFYNSFPFEFIFYNLLDVHCSLLLFNPFQSNLFDWLENTSNSVLVTRFLRIRNSFFYQRLLFTVLPDTSFHCFFFLYFELSSCLQWIILCFMRRFTAKTC